MTIGVYRDGVLAADTAIWIGRSLSGHMTKLARHENGSMIATAGISAICSQMMDHFLAGETEQLIALSQEHDDDVDALIVDEEGVCRSFHSGALLRLRSDYMVIGSGHEIATGALGMKASAEEAVALCIFLHGGCGGVVTSLHRGDQEVRSQPASRVIPWLT
jgi:hypothetical protein